MNSSNHADVDAGPTVAVGGEPPQELEIDVDLARCLLADQCPDLEALPIEPFEAGWDNAHFRVGAELILRLPRRVVAAELVCHEQRWLTVLAPRLPLPVSTPLYAGQPACGYPWSWSVVPVLPGRTVDLAEPSRDAAFKLVDFLRALHQEADAEAPANPFRDVPLQDKEDVIRPRFERLADLGELPDGVLALWQRGVETAIDLEPTWIHGDLHPKNVLVQDGRFSGVIDWGDVTSGDPATDLASIWLFLAQREARASALERYGASTATIDRARAWAVFFGAVFLDAGLSVTGDTDARNVTIGKRALQRALEGP